ncbi:MAG: radical SAM protein [Chloroflexi bacterium]|nr:radical SAM protein [Chloroflexota bacterium]
MPNHRTLLKESARSLCPQCFKEISATIYEEEDGVFMAKSCPEHGSFYAQVESDAAVYRLVANTSPVQRAPESLVIPITHRCNLRCAMCFLPDDGAPDPSQQAIFNQIDRFPGPVIVFSGGEPTVRPDLPELIAYAVRQGKLPWIASNGLRLHDEKLVSRLAEAGLARVLLSINGLSDAVFERIEGRSLLNAKLEAVSGLRRGGLKATLSTTLVSDVNPEVMPQLYAFYLANRDVFGGWRIRTQAAIGKHTAAPRLWLSGMVARAAAVLGVSRQRLLASLDRENTHYGASHLALDLLYEHGAPAKLLGYAAGAPRAAEGPAQAQAAQPHKRLLHALGVTARGHRPLLKRQPPSLQARGLFLSMTQPQRLNRQRWILFAWPDASNVDLDEVEQTGVYHVGPGGEQMPFVKALILNQGRPAWDWEG